MRLLIIPALIGSLALGACNTTNSLSFACAGLSAGHQGFLSYVADNPVAIKKSIIDSELLAYDTGRGLCVDRGTLSLSEALLRIGLASLQITKLLLEAEKQTGVVAEP